MQRDRSLVLDSRGLAGVCWALALVAVFLRAGLAPHAHSVYPIYAEAADHWLAGEDLYRTAGEPYRYSPLVAALLVPFAALPAWLGGLAWRALGVAVYLVGLAWCGRMMFSETRERRGLWLLLVLPLSLGSLNNGQSNVLVLGLILIAVAAVRARRWNLAATCLAVACLFKVYPVAVALLLLVIHPRPLTGRLAVALAVGLVIPFVLQHPGYVTAQYAQWIEHLGANDRHLLAPHLWYRDLRLVVALIGMDLGYEAFQAVQLAAGVALAGVCLLLARAGCTENLLLSLVLGLGCCWMTVLGSATESATYMLLAPSAAWLALNASGAGGWAWRPWLNRSGYVLLCIAPVVQAFGSSPLLWLRALQPAGALVCLAGLFGIVIGHLVRPVERRGICPEYS